MKVKMGMLILLVVLILFAAGRLLYQLKVKQQFSCQAALIQHNEDSSINLSLKFMFKNGYGIVTLNGQSSSPEGLTKKFNRKIYFTYRHDGEFYPLTSKKILKYPDDNVADAWLERYFPAFYISSGQDIYLNIIRQRNGYNIFFHEVIPIFVCKEINMSGR
ncbi:hypothetical protein [Dryocola sp. BD613]|uniref:hypothetical protein n=1 Tax=Dryocola sp. BD613 TaxID=3133272 RepID=UPI003F4FE941